MVSLQQGEDRLLLLPTLRKGTLELEQEERRRGSKRSIGLQEQEVARAREQGQEVTRAREQQQEVEDEESEVFSSLFDDGPMSPLTSSVV